MSRVIYHIHTVSLPITCPICLQCYIYVWCIYNLLRQTIPLVCYTKSMGKKFFSYIEPLGFRPPPTLWHIWHWFCKIALLKPMFCWKTARFRGFRPLDPGGGGGVSAIKHSSLVAYSKMKIRSPLCGLSSPIKIFNPHSTQCWVTPFINLHGRLRFQLFCFFGAGRLKVSPGRTDLS